MKSKQINKEMRYKLRNVALDWKFSAEIAELRQLEGELANALFDFAGFDQANLPAWMLREKGYVQIDGHFFGSYGTKRLHLPKGEVRKQLRSFTIPEEAGESMPKSLLKLLAKFSALDGALSERKAAFRSELGKLLDAVRTTKQLVEVLPAAEQWLPEIYECSDIPQADLAAGLLKI